MREFIYEALPGRIIFGVGASRQQLVMEIERLGVQRVLVIATARGAALAARLVGSLGERVVGSFTDVRPHVPVEAAERARAAARNAGADCLLAIGGGSTTGTAKAITLAVPLPIIAIPTTYAGSEMTPIWGMTSARRKQTGRSLAVLPKVVIYDPELTYALPPTITGTSAMNALAHCVEALYAPGANPMTTLVAEEGIRRIASGLPVAVRQPADPEGRSETLYGAYLGGAALAVAGTGLHHKLCHVLGGAYNLPHAELHAIMLPQVVAFNQIAIPEVMARVAVALGAESAATGLYALADAVGAPVALKELGMREADLDEAVALVLAAASQHNPRPLDAASVRQLLESAYDGRRPMRADPGT